MYDKDSKFKLSSAMHDAESELLFLIVLVDVRFLSIIGEIAHLLEFLFDPSPSKNCELSKRRSKKMSRKGTWPWLTN